MWVSNLTVTKSIILETLPNIDRKTFFADRNWSQLDMSNRIHVIYAQLNVTDPKRIDFFGDGTIHYKENPDPITFQPTLLRKLNMFSF